MNLTTIKQCLPYALKAGITPWFWGEHGKGKSTFVENTFKEMGWVCFNFRLGTQCDVGDILGQSEIEHDENGKPICTKFYKPFWMHSAFEFCNNNPDKGAVIFLDEVNRVRNPDLIPPIFQMALDKRLHTYEFPENLHIIVASNPDTKDYKVLKFKDEAFNDRFWHVKFEPTVEEWLQWCNSENYSSEITGFLTEQPEFIENTNLNDFDLNEQVKRSRRSWNLIQRLYNVDTPKNIILEIGAGIVEPTTIVAWSDYLKNCDKPLTVDEILNKFNKKEIKNRFLKFIDFEKGGRPDILKTTCDQIINEFEKTPDLKLNKTQSKNLLAFMELLPGETLVFFAKKVGKNKNFIDFLAISEANKILKRISKVRGKKEADLNEK